MMNNNNNTNNNDSDVDSDSENSSDNNSDNEENSYMANTVVPAFDKLKAIMKEPTTFEETSSVTARLVFGLFANAASKVTQKNSNALILDVTEKIADLFVHAVELNEIKKEQDSNHPKKENG